MPEESVASALPIEIPKEETEGQYTYIGENNKYILWVVHNPNEATLNTEDLALVEKILVAKGWNLRDIAILNISHYPKVDFDMLKKFFAFNKLIGLGVTPKQLKMESDTVNALFEYDNTKVFFSYALSEMQHNVTDKEKKTTFWNLLKHF